MSHLCQKGKQTAADSPYLLSVKIGREGVLKFILFFYDGYEFSCNRVKSSLWFPAKLMPPALIVAVGSRDWRVPKWERGRAELVWLFFFFLIKRGIFVKEGTCKNYLMYRSVPTIRLGKQVKEVGCRKKREVVLFSALTSYSQGNCPDRAASGVSESP